ncbi:MAG: hypothetical protein MUF01_18955, partial [Bryobacterales bacterium]|nr:hypothetical protein [Bryobacterales bacterium]
FAAVVLLTASAVAKTHTITLHTPTTIAGQELKPGDYKMELNGDTVKLTNGKQTVETTVTVQEAAEKFSKDSVRYTEADGKMKVREIRMGGTNTRLVFQGASSNTSAQ